MTDRLPDTPEGRSLVRWLTLNVVESKDRDLIRRSVVEIERQARLPEYGGGDLARIKADQERLRATQERIDADLEDLRRWGDLRP